MGDISYKLRWPRAAVALLILGSRLNGQSTLAQFQLTEYFGVNWPVQNIEMKYNGGPPPIGSTAMIKNGGAQVPYQWIAPSAGGYNGYGCWDNTATEGCILVQDSLSAATLSGGVPTNPVTNTYTLESGVAPTAAVTNPVTITSGTCQSGVAGWIIANGLTGVCVPKTQPTPYNYAPIQGVQLANGIWTGAVSGTPNLIYTPAGSLAQVTGGNLSAEFETAATIFTGETTTVIDAGPLKTSIQLSYTANRPNYYLEAGAPTTGGTSSGLSFTYAAGQVDCNVLALYFNSTTNLPSPLTTGRVYYNVGCTESGNALEETNYTTTTYELSTTPAGSPLRLGAYTGPIPGVYTLGNVAGPGHLTATLVMYANRPSFIYDYDTDLTGQWFAPMYNEVQPTVREYQGAGSTSAACGYTTPLTITNITTASPPVVTVAGNLAATAGDQVIISNAGGITGANGTWYSCAVTNGPNGSFSLYTSAACTAPVSVSGTYTSGGTAAPQYTQWSTRGQGDAYFNIPYSANYIPYIGVSCGSGNYISSLGINYPPNWDDSGYYDMVYNGSSPLPGTGNALSPVVGLFEGRLSKQFNTGQLTQHAQPGWFASNNHWISAYNVSQSGSNNCSNSGGTCAFGLEHIFATNALATTIHGNFGIYVGTVGQLVGPNAPAQPIKVEQNAEAGLNLSSLYSYNLNYNNPAPAITGASWSSGTESLTLATPTSVAVGDSITVSGFTPSGYNCSGCSVTAVTPTTVSYAVPVNPGPYAAVGVVTDNTNPNYGFTYPYMPTSDFRAWSALFNNSSALCSSTGTCSGPSGYYNNMLTLGFPTSVVAQMWHNPTNTSYVTAAYNGMWTSGAYGNAYNPTAASWANGTETLTIGPNPITVGEEINVSAASSSYNCIACVVTGVTATTVSYAQATQPPATVMFTFMRETGVPGVVNEIANGQGAAWNAGVEYYQWYYNQFGNDFSTCGALYLNPNITAAETAGCKRMQAFAGAVMWDKDFWPFGNINGTGTTDSGDNGGLGNQIVQYNGYQAAIAAQLSYNPYFNQFLNGIQATVLGGLNAGINQYGSSAGSTAYTGTYDNAVYQAFQIMNLSTEFPQITFSHTNYPWAQHESFLANALVPDSRYGNLRKYVSVGDGATSGESTMFGAFIAEGLYPTNPTAAGYGMWGWLEATASPNYPMIGDTAWWINPLVPPVTPTLASINFPGYWSIERYGFGTQHETSVHFVNGDFFSPQGHRHFDDGQTIIYAHNAPLSLDWGTNYDPDDGAAYCHNRIVLDMALVGNVGAWNENNPNCAVTSTGAGDGTSGGWLTANNTNFTAFTNSTQAVATFGYADGSYWQRTVRTMAADTVYPAIYVIDQFFNGSCASNCQATSASNNCATNNCKVLTWNMMANANDPVSTPAGNLTMVPRFSAGCQAVAGEYASANDASGEAPYNLSSVNPVNGLYAFGFTGYTWPALAAGSINWNLYERPTSGQAQFLIGNWGHGCTSTTEAAQFAAANASASWYNIGGTPVSYCFPGNTAAGGPGGSAFCEQQDILRIHDVGPFETTITPVQNGTTLPTVSYSSGAYSFSVGSETWKWGDCDTTAESCYFTFSNGSEQVLTSYDTNSYSAYGMTASGGAQELVNNGGGAITWTIADVASSTRCVTLPTGVGTWYPSAPVQYVSGQYCYYPTGQPQPAPVTITFTHTPATIRTITLSFTAPSGATQVAVKFGGTTNYAALASCSPSCSVTFQAPAGTYTEQHSFLSSAGTVITTSQPISRAY